MKNKVYTINDDVIRYILEVPPTKSTPIMQHLEKKAHPLIFHNVLKVPVQIFGTAGMLFTFKEQRLTTGTRFIVQIKNINFFFSYFILNGLDGMRTNERLPD